MKMKISLGETWSVENEGTSSSDSVSSNESDGSDSKHVPSPAKRSCCTRSGI